MFSLPQHSLCALKQASSDYEYLRTACPDCGGVSVAAKGGRGTLWPAQSNAASRREVKLDSLSRVKLKLNSSTPQTACLAYYRDSMVRYILLLRFPQLIGRVYSTQSTSSMICTFMLPLLRSPQVCSASKAFSNGNVWLTSCLRFRIPPARHCSPAGHVSRYRLMNLRSICSTVSLVAT